jgi:IS1 family transposase
MKTRDFGVGNRKLVLVKNICNKKYEPRDRKITRELLSLPQSTIIEVEMYIKDRWRVFDTFNTYILSTIKTLAHNDNGRKGFELYLDSIRKALVDKYHWEIVLEE